MRVHAAVAALVGICAFAGAARADVELKNDGFVSGGTAGFQGGFVSGEIGASRFLAPAPGRQLVRVQLLFGGMAVTQTITLKVYDDSAGTNAPGTELFSGDYELVGSNDMFQELNLVGAGENIILPQQFRIGIKFNHGGLPSIARDNDGIAADKNYIFAIPGGWLRSQSAGLAGDWIIRAYVSDGGVLPPDAGTGSPDASVGTGCRGNAECPAGQFCDVAQMACTFECRTSDDCGDGTCNSLGQCVGGRGEAGGCCGASGGGITGAALGAGVLLLLLLGRRRRP
jgi:hypothetical protein